MLEGPIRKSILLFALPIFLSNLFQQLYNAADSLIVGNFVDESALAAVSSSGYLVFMLVGFFNGTALGASIVIARYFGAKDYESMQKAIHNLVALGVVFSAVATALGVLLTPAILRLMKTPADVLPLSITYFRIYSCGIVTVIFYNIAVGIMHAVGDSRHPLYYLIVSSVLNVLLDLLFIGVFHGGVGAAAFATVISQGVSAVLCFVQLMHGNAPNRVYFRKIGFTRGMTGQILRYGLPSGIQNSVIAIANLFVQSNINSFDTDAVAGCGSYAKIEGFAFLPVTCFASSLATFVGQNLGAKQFDRVKKGVRFGVICSISMAECIGVIIFVAAPLLVRLFNDSPAVIEYGVLQSRTESLFYFLLAFAHCVAGICRGAGRPIVPMAIMLGFWCVVRVVYIDIVLQFIPQIQMIFWAYPLTWGLSCIVFLIYLLKADWMYHFEKRDRRAKQT